MNPPTDILRRIAELCEQRSPFALVTLLDAQGSTPARIGSRAIIDQDGNVVAGTIGGGALEGAAQQRAAQALRTGEASLFEVDLQGAGPPVPDPICGGRVRVLIDPAPARDGEAYHLAARTQTGRQRGLLLTSATRDDNTPGRPVTILVRWLDEPALDDFAGFPAVEDLHRVLQEGQPRCFTHRTQPGQTDALVERVASAPVLVIIGGGHVGQALALQANAAGFAVTVMDDRDEFTSPGLFPPGTELGRGNLVKQVTEFPFSSDTFIALMTRGHTVDANALEICLKRPHAYLGMIGSRRKIHLVRKAFIESGRATPEEWSGIHAPIGLDIGAVTVPEIAISIVAQLIAVRRRGQADRMPV